MDFSKKRQRKIERDYVQRTQENRLVQKGKAKKVNRKGRKEAQSELYYRIPSILAGIGSFIILNFLMHKFLTDSYNMTHRKTPVDFWSNALGDVPYVIVISLIASGIIYGIVYKKLLAVWFNNNANFLDEDLTEYENDAYIRTLDHIARDYDIAPDAGLGYDGKVSSLMSHIMISNKGIKKINMPQLDKTVDGYVKKDKDGNIVYKTVPMFDETFADELFDMSNVPEEHRIFYDAKDYDFNPKLTKKELGRKKYNKQKKGKEKRSGAYGRKAYDTLADVINNEFFVLDTEAVRPAGVYFYDNKPVHTILIAITRAGKGQTYIEPIFDVWTRAKNKWNVLTTDPKGELLNKFYYPATIRGMEVVQFNLNSPGNTSQFNPLVNALQYFRRNDPTKGAALIDGLLANLFPSNGEIWNPAASNMFRRVVYVLFDYYLEQENYIRHLGYKNNHPVEVIEEEIDRMYSKLTLFNVNALIGELASKMTSDREMLSINPNAQAANEKDLLTVLFDAASVLPVNTLRQLAITANNAVKTVASAPQTLASIYATLLTGMSVYADPTTAALLSGSPKESFDVDGLSFPRRFFVRLDHKYVEKFRLHKETAKWSFYEDIKFTKQLGEGSDDFTHMMSIKDTDWIECYWKGILPNNVAYVKLEVESKGYTVQTFYFKFEKGYRTFEDITYILNPVTNKKIISGGFLTEIDIQTGLPKISEYEIDDFDLVTNSYRSQTKPIIIASQVFYSEMAKFIFAVTPPHKMHYQIHILTILIQLIHSIYDQSYTKKASGKPVIGTHMMLEEFGNIRSGENGLPDLDTVTSIALGQDLQMTFVLQSFQQLRSVYGEDIEKIVKANSSNIIFLKSNDEDLINDLVRLSGQKHEVRTNGKSISREKGDLIAPAASSISYNINNDETTNLAINDLLFLADAAPGNSLTFVSNEMPIVNKLSQIQPMAARLHKDMPQPKEGKYSDATLPSLSLEIVDGTVNTIDGEALVRARVKHATIAKKVKEDVLKLSKRYNKTIEDNGELSNLMMNTVYELYDKAGDHARSPLSNRVNYTELAKQMKEALDTIKRVSSSKDKAVRQQGLIAIRQLKDILVRCALDDELLDITKIYIDKRKQNTLGYDANAVAKFIEAMIKRYPEAEKLKTRTVDVHAIAAENPNYKPYRGPNDYAFDILNPNHTSALEDIIFDIVVGTRSGIPGLQVIMTSEPGDYDDAKIYDVKVSGKKLATYTIHGNENYSCIYINERDKACDIVEENASLVDAIHEIIIGDYDD